MPLSILSFGLLLTAACANQLLLPKALPPSVAANASSYTDCANAAWPPSGVGVELVPQAPDDELKAMLAVIDPARIEATIKKLVSFGTRHTLSTQTDPKRGIGAARDWIASEMRKYANESEGMMTVTVPGYTQGVASRIPFPVKISNVLATIEGSSDPARVYVITGHYDSRVTDVLDYTSDAPGANDDASGTALVMELARILASKKPKATIILGAVAGEEQNLYGSTFLAQTLKNSSTNVEGMLNNDIVGSSTGDRGQKDPFTIRIFCQGPPLTESASVTATRLQIGGENDSPARELGRFSNEVAANDVTGMNIAIINRLDRYLRGGDHSSFLQQGYAAIRYTEPNENFNHQHQNIRIENGTQYGDLMEFVDFEYTARVAKVNLATLWSLANAPGRVRNVTVDTTTLGNDSKFKWIMSNDTDLAGYEVVWRPTTAPLWTHMLFVGMANTATVSLSKDNMIFGIRAVGKNGYKSPATMPFPS
ncbi:putative zinc metalloprotease [Lindgomyces ingoldianus]|uniref:Zinc metalloprotease n=1 Tax=Lindgomyces ingoldianus TaxID=673940 RepID=A0ACB6R1R0_9PLEO|nr:putative zinc metalloprotease [Lindgomyces ingoldianus]KAF2472982.1 putative zinc metalloprotease [Lindgomyces ingoldianus]